MNELFTLKAIRMEWIVILPKLEILFLLGSIVGGVAASFFAHNAQYLAIGAAIGFLSSFIVEATYFVVFYNFVKCPECGEQLNRFKNGKNVSRKQTHAQLMQDFGCRHCGWNQNPLRQLMQVKNECADRTFDGESIIMIPDLNTTMAAISSNSRYTN